MDSFVVPKAVEDAFEEKYRHIRYLHRDLPEAEAHRAAVRVAIHEALLKECDLGLITFTEKSVYWIPENAASFAKPDCPICKGSGAVEVDGTRYLCECTGIESAVPRKSLSK